MGPILVLYYSRSGSTRNLAYKIAQGIERQGCEARIRTVPAVSDNLGEIQSQVPDAGDVYVSKQDLQECSGLALGSPTRFGNMAAAMKYFWDSTTGEWLSGCLVDKPACVFTSSGSLHGGQETTLMSMMLPLMHHGMVMVGIPYTEPQLQSTQSGGTPYGVTHHAGIQGENNLSEDEQALAVAQGSRLARIAKGLTTQRGS